MILYHTNTSWSQEGAIKIGEYSNLEELKIGINSYLSTIPNADPYYRIIDAETGLVIDYGSWVKFLLVTGISYFNFIGETEESYKAKQDEINKRLRPEMYA